MPLHLEAITRDSQNSSLLAWLLQNGMDECDSVFVSEDLKYFHIQRSIVDVATRSTIGRLVYTIKHGEEVLQILDLDIVLDTETTSVLHFIEMLRGSSDANEYYEVETANENQHLVIETVNRHTVSEELLNTERQVYISVFPFKVSIFKNMRAFHKWAGFGKPVTVGNTEYTIGGFSETFTMPCRVFNDDPENDECYSFIAGRVKSFKDAKIKFGDYELPFIIAQIDTALGTVPAAIGRDVFDLSELKEGCIIAMYADVKADVSKPEQFKKSTSNG